MRHILARINEDLLPSEIAKEIDVLQAIEWVAKAWDDVIATTIKNCFSKCGFNKATSEIEDDEVDAEFNELFKEFTEANSGITAEEYIDFDIETCTSAPMINSDEVDWRAGSVQKCVSEYKI